MLLTAEPTLKGVKLLPWPCAAEGLKYELCHGSPVGISAISPHVLCGKAVHQALGIDVGTPAHLGTEICSLECPGSGSLQKQAGQPASATPAAAEEG